MRATRRYRTVCAALAKIDCSFRTSFFDASDVTDATDVRCASRRVACAAANQRGRARHKKRLRKNESAPINQL